MLEQDKRNFNNLIIKMNPLALQDVDNEMLRDADEYLRKHKIIELFEDLTTLLAYKQPDNIEQFIID